MVSIPRPSNSEADSSNDADEKLQRYELIFQATNDLLYDLHLDSATVEWNDALYTQYGYTKQEPASTLEWWTRHVHPEDALLLEHKITDMFSSAAGSWQYEYRFQRADGGYSYVRDRGLLLRDATGKPVRILGSLLDITAQKQLDSAKDEFISLVSHQLRTPLTVIRVYGEMLMGGLSGDLSDEQLKWIKSMTNSSARLIDVVGDILNVSRLDLGRVNITTKPVDLYERLEAYVREVQPLAEEKQVELKLRRHAAAPNVAIDDTALSQVVHNLLTNAIRYTNPQKGKIEISLQARNDGYTIRVTDNGIGIPKEAQAHIFERFYRAKNALAIESQGSGLGLYLIKVMVDAFGGKLWFESAANKGTSFYVWIPPTGMAALPPEPNKKD